MLRSVSCGMTVAIACAAESHATDMTLCGWFVNPTPANVSLLDRHGEWSISVQGGPEAEGDWPTFKPSQWIRTNGHYGYGCACMRVTADAGTRRVAIIKSAHARALAVCEKDRSLKAPP